MDFSDAIKYALIFAWLFFGVMDALFLYWLGKKDDGEKWDWSCLPIYGIVVMAGPLFPIPCITWAIVVTLFDPDLADELAKAGRQQKNP